MASERFECIKDGLDYDEGFIPSPVVDVMPEEGDVFAATPECKTLVFPVISVIILLVIVVLLAFLGAIIVYDMSNDTRNAVHNQCPAVLVPPDIDKDRQAERDWIEKQKPLIKEKK
jgi:hypothetical protein